MLMTVLAGTVVVVFGLFLMGLAALTFVKPAAVEQFFRAFASSAKAHFTEQACRLVFGGALVLLAPAMWQGAFFRLLGWLIAVTAVALILLPWRWHHRFGQWAIPLVLRHLRLYAVGLFAFGALLLFATLYAGP